MKLRDHFVKRWVCQVQRSGFHNGCECDAREPHAGRDCGWRMEASLTLEAWEAKYGRLGTPEDDAQLREALAGATFASDLHLPTTAVLSADEANDWVTHYLPEWWE